MSKILFLAGVHGVGKSTLAEFLSNETGMQFYSSSELIRAEKRAPVDSGKSVVDPEDNQNYLINAIIKIIANRESLILDGHFTLWGSNSIFNVPISLFERLPIAGSVVLFEEPEIICSRLRERDSKEWEVSDISHRQEMESVRADFISNNVHFPLLKIKAHQSDIVLAWINEHME